MNGINDMMNYMKGNMKLALILNTYHKDNKKIF